jgi:hypothetical protein
MGEPEEPGKQFAAGQVPGGAEQDDDMRLQGFGFSARHLILM